VVFHLLFHEVLIGELNGKLPEEEEKVAPLQRNKRAKQHAPVRVVFHLLFHEVLIGELNGKLPEEEEKVKVAPLQRKKKGAR
jgi:hypothetical protein